MASRLEDVILRGIAASRPAATAVAAGTLHYATDTHVLERSTGSAWESYSATAASGTVVGPSGALDQAIALFDGATGNLLKDSGVLVTALAPKASPALTGVPTVPTATVGTNTTQAASTAFVLANAATLPISLTTQVTGTLQAAQEPAHTGDVTNSAGSLALAIGTTTVTNAMLAGSIAASKLVGTDLVLAESQVMNLPSDLALKAPLAAPTFTGVSTFTGQFGPALVNDGNSGSALTINFNGGNDRYITLTGNVVITLTNPISGFRYALVFNTGAGGFTPTFSPTLTWLDAVPTLPTTASKLYVVVLLYLGTVSKYLANFSKEP